jgi:hypothetical protein
LTAAAIDADLFQSYCFWAIALAPLDFPLPNLSPVEAVMRLFCSLILAVFLAAGCSSNSPEQPAPKAPQYTANDTPAHAVQRFLQSYMGKQETIYTSLFTKDFVFDFSNTTDPTLVTQYVNGWVKNDEFQSATHLFHGVSPAGAPTLPAASSIQITFANMTPIGDGSSTDQLTHQVLITRVDGSVAVPQSGSEPLTYLITNNLNVFYLVRGDAATSLDAGQPADSSHWYVYRWQDQTGSAAAGRLGRWSTQQTTWAKIRALYRSSNDPSLAANETPEGAMARLVGSYERMLPGEYAGMFTGDFTFEFSNATDPTLVQQYSTGWFKTDEKESSSHLFTGYTPPGGATLPPATSIDIVLASGIPGDDNTSPDPTKYKVLLTRVDGSITVPQSGSEPLTFFFSNNLHEFHLVRGDAAVNLDASQPADAQHWYIYRWVDLTGTAPKASGPATKATTWADVKATYR